MTADQPSPTPESSKTPDRRTISDPRAIRALAHPMRIALLEAIAREGELTATRAAELLDDSPGNMSWHLQTLAKYGYIEEAGTGSGRRRPWRAVSVSNRFDTAADGPEPAAAGEALESSVIDFAFTRLREWWSRRRTYPVTWQRASFMCDSITYLTSQEMEQLGEDVGALLARYNGRIRDRGQRPADSLPVHVVAFGHPLPPTPSGN